MSWRRFKTLLNRGLVVKDKDNNSAYTPVEDEEFDWNRALDKVIGRETPTNVTRMSFEDLKKVAH